MQQRHVIAEPLDFFHARGDLLRWNIPGTADFVGFNLQIGYRRMRTEQHIALVLLGLAEEIVVMAHRQRLAGYHFCLAQAANAIAASVAQRNARAQRGIQNGIGTLHEEFVAVWKQADSGGHQP